MKDQLSAVELSYVVQEVQLLVNAKVEKIFGQPKPTDSFLFSLHSASVGKSFLYVDLPGICCQVQFKPSFPATPPSFVSSMRRKLTNARITAIEQVGFERILKLTFLSKHGEFFLYLELFTPGNIVLTDETNRIIATLYHKIWNEQRDIRPGKRYALPQEQLDPRTLTKESFTELVHTSNSHMIVKTLAMECSLGGVYAEEVLARTTLDKETAPKEIPDGSIEELFIALQQVLTTPIAAVTDGAAVFPFTLQKAKNPVSADSFNESIAQLVLLEAQVVEEKEFTRTASKTTSKYEKIISAQKKSLSGLAKKETAFQLQAEAIYANHPQLSTLLYALQTDLKKMTPIDFKKKYAGLSFIKEVNLKDKTITVEVPDNVQN